MIEHVWSVLCAQAVVDKTTNNISLFNVIEQLQISVSQPLPEGTQSVPFPHNIVSTWQRADYEVPAETRARIRLKGPTREYEGQAPFEVNIQEEDIHRRRTVVSLTHIPLSGPGLYHFIIEQEDQSTDGWVQVAKLPLEVRLTSAEEEVSAGADDSV